MFCQLDQQFYCLYWSTPLCDIRSPSNPSSWHTSAGLLIVCIPAVVQAVHKRRGQAWQHAVACPPHGSLYVVPNTPVSSVTSVKPAVRSAVVQ